MANLLSAYLRMYDIGTFLGQAGRGYVRTKCTTAQFGQLPVVRGKVKFHVRGEAVFGRRFTALGDTTAVRIDVAEGGRLTVGDNVAMNSGVSVEVWHEVRIGDKVMMGPNVSVIDDDRHELEPGTPLYKGPTIIGDNVWLAANVSVLPGVTIGSGSVIGGNSVVSRDIPPNCFAAGAPAKMIKNINVPEGWSHRFGYQAKTASGGILASLRRAFARDPNAAIAEASAAAAQGSADGTGRDREAVG